MADSTLAPNPESGFCAVCNKAVPKGTGFYKELSNGENAVMHRVYYHEYCLNQNNDNSEGDDFL